MTVQHARNNPLDSLARVERQRLACRWLMGEHSLQGSPAAPSGNRAASKRPRAMSPARRACLEATISSSLTGAVALGMSKIAAPHTALPWAIRCVGWLAALACGLAAAAALLVMYRHHLIERGRQDLFLRLNAPRDAALVSAGTIDWGIGVRRALRSAFGGSNFLVGDLVEVRPLEEIRRTLDTSGRLGGLPLMEEMIPFCGRRFRVFRCVDKMLDVGGSWRMRRMNDVVLLARLRCDGGGHGGCQAGCYLFWKTAWLAPVSDRADPHEARFVAASIPPPRTSAPGSRYSCQFTEMNGATTPLNRWDLRQDLKPLLAGNLTLAAFVVAMATRVFNKFSRPWRAAVYPPPLHGSLKRTPLPTISLGPGERVRILPPDVIEATLNAQNRNRGLFFEREQIKHCGQRGRVAYQVERLIDITNGTILSMKTPSYVLESVDRSDELMRFCAHHEQLYWRQVWLQREDGAGSA